MPEACILAGPPGLKISINLPRRISRNESIGGTGIGRGDGIDANLGNRHYATYGLFYKREAAWWTSSLLPAKYSRLNFGVRLYTNPMFVHLQLTNVFRIDHTPNDRAQRFQLDSGVVYALSYPVSTYSRR